MRFPAWPIRQASVWSITAEEGEEGAPADGVREAEVDLGGRRRIEQAT